MKFASEADIEKYYEKKTKILNDKKKADLWVFRNGVKSRPDSSASIFSNKKSYDKKCLKLAKGIAKRRDRCCQKCIDGGVYERVGLDGSHVISNARSTRLSVDPDNIIALCRYHHTRRHENPKESLVWFIDKYPGRYELLQKKLSLEKIGSINMDWWEKTYQYLLSYK